LIIPRIIINIFNTLFDNKNILLTPNSKPFFIFIDKITEEREEGIDAGGLTRTVFNELSLVLLKKYFTIDDDTKLCKLKYFSDESVKDKIFFIGQLFGLAIKLNQTIQINLDPILLYQLTHELDVDNLSEDIIRQIIIDYDEKLLKTYPYQCYNKDLICELNLKGICLVDDENEVINTNNDYKKETTKKIIEGLKKNNIITQEFIKGFRSQIDITKSKIDNLPIKQLDILIAGN